MLDFDKIYELLRIALITGAINSLLIQKIKCKFIKNDCIIVTLSLIISMLIGTLFTLSFTKLTLTDALWVGIFTFVHAEAIFNVIKKTANIHNTGVITDIIEVNNSKDEKIEIKDEPKSIQENEDDLGEG